MPEPASLAADLVAPASGAAAGLQRDAAQSCPPPTRGAGAKQNANRWLPRVLGQKFSLLGAIQFM